MHRTGLRIHGRVVRARGFVDSFRVSGELVVEAVEKDTFAALHEPLDIRTAHSAGGRCVAVATGRYARNDLVEADAVISALDELPDALARLATVD